MCFCLCGWEFDTWGFFVNSVLAGVCCSCKSPESELPRTEGTCGCGYLLMSRQSLVRPSSDFSLLMCLPLFGSSFPGWTATSVRRGFVAVFVWRSARCCVVVDPWIVLFCREDRLRNRGSRASGVPGVGVGPGDWDCSRACGGVFLVSDGAAGVRGGRARVPSFMFQVRPGSCPGTVAMRSRGVAWLGGQFQVVSGSFGVFLVA